MKIIAGIILGIIIALTATKVFAGYTYSRLSQVDFIKYEGQKVYIIWDDVEKTNCYVLASEFTSNSGGISCIRSMN